ncbi:hypothetical protein [Parvularcula sp. IMCC14364]|uniref:hypothetical protein n=1 Tax=Parvularcula sp. IMCC14364 TaxID=3067902 RepID=UPI0027420605|nr:hypothetical protein [Parvularcula sp. IMCC14364]
MARYWENDHYIRDLHEAASFEADRRVDDGYQFPVGVADIASSRAAMLSLVDTLARSVTRQLLFLASAGIFVAIVFLLSVPALEWAVIGRLSLWLLLLFGALTFSWHSVRSFRFGFGYSGKPFTWRTDYTCMLAVISTAFGVGSILLTPETISLTSSVIISTLTVLIALVFGFGHIAWQPAAVTSALPAVLIAHLSLLFHIFPLGTETQQALAIWLGSLLFSLVCFVAGYRRARKIAADALARHPRNAMRQIQSRHKKTSGAYNPYSIRAREVQAKHPASLEAERAVTGGNRSH